MRISHATERTRRALWVMYTRLTSTRLHKFYTLALLITLLPLIILHLLALSNTTTALSKLSILLSTTNSTNDDGNSVVPTVTDQDGQGILQLCNVGRSDCQTVTSVAPTETETATSRSTSTPTPQQVASPINTVPVNAAPTNSAIPVPDVAIQPGGGARPASPASPASSSLSSPSSSLSTPNPPNSAPPPPPPQGSDGGVLIAAPPAQTQAQPSSSTSISRGVFIADVPSTTSVTSTTSTASTLKKSSAGNGGTGDDNKGTSVETSTTTTSAEKDIATEIDSSVVSSSSSGSTTIAATRKESSTSTDSSTTATPSSTSSTSSTSSIAIESPSSKETSSRSKETDSSSEGTGTSAPVVGKDVSVHDGATLSSSTTTDVLPSLVHPEFKSSTVLSSSVLSTTISPSSSTTSPSSSSSSSVDATKDEAKDSQESSSTSRTTESSTPTPTPTSTSSKVQSQSDSGSESTESTETKASPSTLTPNTHFFSSRHLSPRAFSATPITNSTTGALDGIDVTDVDDTGGTEVTRLGVVCAIAMAFPRDQLRQEWMENLTMVAFYLGMLGVGIAAILNESVAHLITISLSALLSLLWTGTQLVRTHYLHDQFDAFITRGACSGIDVLPSYWAQRARLELPILIINALALLLLGVLAVQLFKRYHREGGGGRGVERYVYKVVVILRCAVLLGGFLLVAGMGVWVHLLFTNAGVVGASGVDLLEALGIVSLVFVLPWAVLGWLALNAASLSTSGAYSGGTDSQNGKWGRWWGKRTMMAFFCGLNVLFLGGWVATFASDVYRAVFLAWTFFAVLSIAGFFVLMGSLGAGVICWMRFARGLQDFDSEKLARDMSRPFRIASIDSFGIVTSIDPFGVRPSGHSHSHSGHSHSHSHVHGGVGLGLSVPESLPWDYSNTAEKAWEPFDKASIRQSQFTASEGRQSTVFSYGLRSPAPPMPTRPEDGSSNNSNVSLGLAL